MRSGALCEEERPLWYDIYAAFPPKKLRTFDSQVEVPTILYPEDIIRVYCTFFPLFLLSGMFSYYMCPNSFCY